MAQEIRTSTIEIDSNGTTVPAYQCLPSGEGSWPGLVVIQEWWGLEPHIKDIAERYARAGFAVVAPDLYHGDVTSEPDEARKLVMALDRPRAVRELVSAVGYLKSQSFTNGKVGTVGYCMGGGLSITTACNTTDLDAAVIYYGGNPDPIDQVSNVHCAVLGLYGGDDGGASPCPSPPRSPRRWRPTERPTTSTSTVAHPTHSSTIPGRAIVRKPPRIRGTGLWPSSASISPDGSYA